MSSSEKIAKNTIFLYIRLIFTLCVSLFTSRLVLKALQVQDYGIVSIVGGVVAIFGFLNFAMASSTVRFLTFDIGKKDKAQLNKTFNTAIVIHLGIALIVFLLAETIGLWYVNNYLNVPKARLEATNWVFQFSVFSTLIGISQAPFHALIFANERMNVYAIVSVVDGILKLIGVYMLFIIEFDKLELYSVVTFGTVLIQAIFYIVYCSKNFDEIAFRFYKDKAYYYKLISYSGWNLIGNLAMVAKIQGTNLLLNLFFGTLVNAAYGVTMQVHFAVAGFVSNFQMAVNPQIIKNYSLGNTALTAKLIYKGAKYSFFLMLLLSNPVIYNTEYLLSLWLAKTPQYAPVFVKLALVFLLVDTISGPLITGAQATGNIKWYQIIIGILIFLNLPINYLVLRYNLGVESVYFVNIFLGILIVGFRLVYVNRALKLDLSVFFSEVLLKIFLVLAISVFSGLVMQRYMADSVLGIWMQMFIHALITLLTIYTFGIDKSERKMLLETLARVIMRKR